MDINEKMAQAMTMDSEIQLVAKVLSQMLSSDEKLAIGFVRDEFTWEKMKKFLNEKARPIHREKKLGSDPLMVSGQTIMAWVKEFFLLDEPPKEPEIPRPAPPTKTTVAKKRGASTAPASPEIPLHESDAREEDEEDESEPVCRLPVLSKANEDENDEHNATAALKKQISLFEMA